MSLTKVVSNSSGYLPQLQNSVVNTMECLSTSSNSLKIFASRGTRSTESFSLEKILPAKQIVEEEEKIQTWSDGSVFSGSFQNGHRHGRGEATWPNGEVYSGDFVNDKREGRGIYTWPDGSKYEGHFKANKRSGYGLFEFPNGDYFEGIYVDDIRNGPGIFTYSSEGVQDIGIWLNERLIKICKTLKNSFTFKNYSHHSINAIDKQAEMNIDNKIKKKKKLKVEEQKSVLHAQVEEQTPIWSASEDILHTIPERFNYKDIIYCMRDNFGPVGPLETKSEKLINAAIIGDILTTEAILKCGDIHPDVADRTGFGAMLAAAVNCHADVLNCLLDFGASVNKLNDEGLSPLAACHVLHYTNQDFIDNIAENIPKENIFNSIEWEKQRGCYIHRNDKKTILSMYGTIRSTSNETTRGKAARRTSTFSSQGLVPGDRILDMDAANENTLHKEEEDDEQQTVLDNWKMTYYQRTLSRGEELEEINKSFQKLKARPFDYQNVYDESDPPPLSVLAAERVAEEIAVTPEEEEERGSKLTEESVYMGLGSFGIAPRIEMSSEDAKQRLLNAERKPHLTATIHLLLNRGANPNASILPMPVLFFAVKAADTSAVEALLSKGADTSIRLDSKNHGLAPLHIAVALPCAEGIEITRLLLEAKADPDLEDLAYGNSSNGRTALHIACTREDCDKDAQKVVEYLLQHKANPDLLCEGHSPLSLAICSGNDLIVDTLLKYGANPSLKLTNGVGSALCSAATFCAERRRQPNDRIKLIDKLVKAGTDLLAPIMIMEKLPPGTAVDYAYHIFNQDRRIAHTPYHALTAVERACHNTRKEVLEHLGHLLRTAALKREKDMLEAELKNIAEAEAASTLAGTANSQIDAELPTTSGKRSPTKKPTGKDKIAADARSKSPRRYANCGLPFAVVKSNDPKTIAALEMNAANQRRLEAKRRFRYCYECGRLIGVRLAACTRCKEVFYCSKNCKVKAWNLRHKEECARFTGRKSANGRTAGSPTRTTNADDDEQWHFGGNKMDASRVYYASSKVDDTSRQSSRKGDRKTKNKLASSRQVSASSKPSKPTSVKMPTRDLKPTTAKESMRETKLPKTSKRPTVSLKQ